MRKKLVLLCFALLALGGLLAAPAPVAASNPNCPPTCPIPGAPDITAYCSAQCGSNCDQCFYACYSCLRESCQSTCTTCGVCCDCY